MKQVYSLLLAVVLVGFAACGEEAPNEKMPVKTEIVDTGNIQDGTEKEKTLDVDTPATE